MKTILFIIQKEFKQIFRDKGMLPIIFVLPLIQLLILSNAASFEINNIKFSYIDHDRSAASRELISKFQASSYFKIIDQFNSKEEADFQMQKGNVDIILEIPNYFERDLLKEKSTNLSVSINAIDGASAGVENVYVAQIIASYNQKIQTQLWQYNNNLRVTPQNIVTIPSFWYNNTLN